MKKEKKEKHNELKKDEKGVIAEKDDFSEWFSQLMIKAELADYTEVSGCIVFRPSSYAMWEIIQKEVDKKFKELGIKNAYFPLLIPEKFLNKEKEHVAGFSPEVGWVTEAGESKLSERLAIRPTSETIMYPSYAKWIRSWRDLPLKINQWNNVLRFEFKHPVPFFRTREFLWNELHSVFASEEEAVKEGKNIINVYKEVTEGFMALYGAYGRKTDKEKFAGGVFSEKLHYVMPNGKVAEGPCFHHDGQNFAKAYDIMFLDKEGKKQYAWQNTYAISTRMLGVMFAIHSDNKGLILPPKMASNKIVIVPIVFEDSKKDVLKFAEEVRKKLDKFGAFVDDRDIYKPGYKFNEWELKGIPLRIEIGPKEVEKNKVITVRRDENKKDIFELKDIDKKIDSLLYEIQENLYKRSEKLFKSKIESADSLDKLKKIINNKKVGIVPLCKKESCEDTMKFETKGAKALFIAEKAGKNARCIICRENADYLVYSGKSY